MEKWIETKLSSEQKKPFYSEANRVCILASAGSGKTRTLTHLVADDLASGVPASNVVVFTFTRKAADELLARIHRLISNNIPHVDLEGIYIGTIHAWCFKYLKNIEEFYNPTPLDELHVDALASRFYDFLGLYDTYNIPYPHGIDRFVKDVEVFYNEKLSYEDIPDEILNSLRKYLDLLSNNRLITYGGMIRSAIDHLTHFGPVNDLKSLYVDEYQDVNPAQVQLIKEMLPKEASLTVVGDELQCIYDWRGSDIRRIVNFEEDFENTEIFRLVDNYRSRPSIVDVCNEAGEEIEFRDAKKTMVPTRPELDVANVCWISTESDESQAKAVAELVENYVNNGVPQNKIAILLRSVTSYGGLILEKIKEKNISVNCPILSRGGRFINHFLVPLIDWLREDIQEPKNRIEKEEIEQKAQNLWISANEWINADENISESVFWKELNRWQEKLDENRNDSYNIRGCLYDFLDGVGIRVAALDHNLMVGLGIASQIIRSVEEIHRRRVEGHSRRSARGVLNEVYHALVRRQDDFGESLSIDESVNAVILTTVHQAKGLEWPVVIIPMLKQGRFPTRSRGHNTSYEGNFVKRYGTSLDDERRLFYVALTRAQEKLFVLDPSKGDEDTISIFLRELKKKTVIFPSPLNEIDKHVWSINPEALRETDPPPLRISLSDLLIYLECPYQYSLRRIVSIQPSVGEELGFGQSLHELIQRRFEEGEFWSDEVLSSRLDDHVRLPYMSAKGEKSAREAIKDRLWLLQELNVFNFDVETELDIEVLIDKAIIVGTVDLIQMVEEKEIIIRDWKSNIHEEFFDRYKRQILFYTWALEKRGYKVIEADIVDVSTSFENKELISYNIDIAKPQIDEFIDKVNRGVDGILKSAYQATPGLNACSSCDMYRLCDERMQV